MKRYILEAQHLLADRKTVHGDPWLVEVIARNLDSAIETVRKGSSFPLLIRPVA
jgi:hypothetical protein